MGYFDGQDASFLNTDSEIANSVAGWQRAAGRGTGLGAILPASVRAGVQVPLVSGLRVASSASLNGSTSVTLAWFEPYNVGGSPIATYNVYVKNAVAGNQAPQLVASSVSPAKFTVQADAINKLVFVVQTVLQNGQTSSLANSPACTVQSVSPALTPAAIAAPQIAITGLTLTNNSPGAGNVAWSACTVYYNGSAFAVSGGNTTGGNGFIYWTVSGGTFTQAASFSPGATIFLVATNVAGTADTAWNKVAAKHLQEANLGFSLLTGQQTQPLVTSTILNSTGFTGAGAYSTTLLTTTGDGTHIGGGLLTVAVRAAVARTGVGGTSAPAVDISIQVDGLSAQLLRVYDFDTLTFSAQATDIATRVSGDGSNVGDTVVFSLGIGFTASLSVVYVRNFANGNPSDAGSNAASLLYCTKTT